MVALGSHEDLGLVHEAAKRFRVDDAVSVALERRAQATGRFLEGAAARLVGADGKRREGLFLVLADPSFEGIGDRSGNARHQVKRSPLPGRRVRR